MSYTLCRCVRSSQLSLNAGGRAPPRFPCSSADYTLLAELGLGVTATVYLALCKPLRRKVAVKLLDLEAIEQAGGLVRSRVQGLTTEYLVLVLALPCCAARHAMSPWSRLSASSDGPGAAVYRGMLEPGRLLQL